MTRLLAFVFCAALFSVVFVQEASARRGGGIHLGGGNLRGFSARGYGRGLRARNFGGYRAAALGGRRDWRGRRWYGYGVGLAALGGAYAAAAPDDDYSYYGGSPYYGYAYSGNPGYRSSYGYGGTGTYGYSSAAATDTELAGPGTCGTYRYFKDGRCVDARSK